MVIRQTQRLQIQRLRMRKLEKLPLKTMATREAMAVVSRFIQVVGRLLEKATTLRKGL